MLKKPRVPKVLIVLASLAISGMIAGLVFGILIFYFFGRDLPDYSKLANYTPAGTTRLYASDGQLMAEYATQKRIYLPFDRMPRRLVQAFIAAEDKNFYTHTGIDANGILRAAWSNIRSMGEQRSLVGGSTITQQVVKNFLLTREKSISRKVKEAIIAYRVTRHYSKDKILELYLNEIYLGMGAYGIVAAAEEYFGKSPDALSTEEMALLAAMPKAPASYDPRFNPKRAEARRNYVIKRMYEDGYINLAEEERALQAPLVLREQANARVQAAYFSEEVRRHLMQTYGMKQVYAGGMFVRTTLRPTLQALADRALRNALIAYDLRHGYRGPLGHIEAGEDWEQALAAFVKEKHPPVYDDHQVGVILNVESRQAEAGLADGTKGTLPFTGMQWARRVAANGALGALPAKASDVVKVGDVVLLRPQDSTVKHAKKQSWALIQVPKVNGGMIAMDPKTGRVYAMSGGFDPLHDEFNRVTQAKRQPGSAFKPFVYLTALEHGFTPASIVLDEPIELSQGPGLPMWRPKNYGNEYLGPATLRMGLEKSRNLMTVRLAQALGIHRVAQVAKRFGIYEGDLPENYSMVLGSVETTLFKLATAYSALANGGLKVTPTLIERIDDQGGKNLYRFDARTCAGCAAGAVGGQVNSYAPPVQEDKRERIADPRIAYQMVSLLRGVVQRGTAIAASRLGKPLAGKTGTTNDSRDAWFMGFSPDLVVGVYIGFDQPKDMGGKETGGRVALPAFIEVMEQELKDKPVKAFFVPPGIQEVMVDRMSGLPPPPGFENTPGLIQEAFIYGGPIFIPEGEMETTGAEGVEGEEAVAPEEYDPALASPQGEQDPALTPPAQQRPVYPDAYNRDRYEGYRTPPSRARGSGRYGPADMGTGALY